MEGAPVARERAVDQVEPGDGRGRQPDPAWRPARGDAVELDRVTAPVAVGDLYFRLFVTDNGGSLSDPDVVIVHLVANNAPTANAGAPQTNKATSRKFTRSAKKSVRCWPITRHHRRPLEPATINGRQLKIKI